MSARSRRTSMPERGATLDRIWAGWRSEYVADSSRVEGDGSVFTRILAAVDAGDLSDETAYIVARGDHVFCILNAYPYGTGHMLVMPYREVPDLSDLTDAESEELWGFIRHAVAAARLAYSPGGVNVGFNLGDAAGAGVPGHLHGHVLPRWNADSNFMTTLAEARVLPESLPATWAKLSEAWVVATPSR